MTILRLSNPYGVPLRSTERKILIEPNIPQVYSDRDQQVLEDFELFMKKNPEMDKRVAVVKMPEEIIEGLKRLDEWIWFVFFPFYIRRII